MITVLFIAKSGTPKLSNSPNSGLKKLSGSFSFPAPRLCSVNHFVCGVRPDVECLPINLELDDILHVKNSLLIRVAFQYHSGFGQQDQFRISRPSLAHQPDPDLDLRIFQRFQQRPEIGKINSILHATYRILVDHKKCNSCSIRCWLV